MMTFPSWDSVVPSDCAIVDTVNKQSSIENAYIFFLRKHKVGLKGSWILLSNLEYLRSEKMWSKINSARQYRHLVATLTPAGESIWIYNTESGTQNLRKARKSHLCSSVTASKVKKAKANEPIFKIH